MTANWLARAEESLAGARAELDAGRPNNSAGRSYYGAYQAAVALLIHEHVDPDREMWTHEEVWRDFEEVMSKEQATRSFVGLLARLSQERVNADYTPAGVSRLGAEEALAGAIESLAFVRARVAEPIVG